MIIQRIGIKMSSKDMVMWGPSRLQAHRGQCTAYNLPESVMPTRLPGRGAKLRDEYAEGFEDYSTLYDNDKLIHAILCSGRVAVPLNPLLTKTLRKEMIIKAKVKKIQWTGFFHEYPLFRVSDAPR